MKVNSISFGKTVKVLAPLHEATRIANAANGDRTVPRRVQKKVKNIFDDTKEGHAIAFSFCDDPSCSYIVSGKESKEYVGNLFEEMYSIKKIKMNYPTDIALRAVLKVREDYTNKTKELIRRTRENYALEVAFEGKDVEIV